MSEPSSPPVTGLIDRDPPSISFFGLEDGTRLGTRRPAIFADLDDPAGSGIDLSSVTLRAYGLSSGEMVDLTSSIVFSPPSEGRVRVTAGADRLFRPYGTTGSIS